VSNGEAAARRLRACAVREWLGLVPAAHKAHICHSTYTIVKSIPDSHLLSSTLPA